MEALRCGYVDVRVQFACSVIKTQFDFGGLYVEGSALLTSRYPQTGQATISG